MALREIPPTQPVPDVRPGDVIEARCPFGKWFTARAMSAPRYDHSRPQKGIYSVALSVAIDTGTSVVNYPIEDIRPASDARPATPGGEG